MPDSGSFADRLAYIRLLRWMTSGRRDRETDAELAEALGVTQGWIAKWKARDDSPNNRTETDAIVAALAPMGVSREWILDGKGDAPQPAVWAAFVTGTPLDEDIPAARPAKKARRTARG